MNHIVAMSFWDILFSERLWENYEIQCDHTIEYYKNLLQMSLHMYKCCTRALSVLPVISFLNHSILFKVGFLATLRHSRHPDVIFLVISETQNYFGFIFFLFIRWKVFWQKFSLITVLVIVITDFKCN